VFFFLNEFGVVNIGGTAGTGDGTGTGPGKEINVKVDTGCSVDQTTYNTKHFNKYLTGTTLSTEFSHLFLADGSGKGDQGQYSDGQTKTVSPGNKLTIYAGENSTARYTQKIDTFLLDGASSDSVPCKVTLDVVAYLAPMDSGPTVSWVNEEGTVKASQTLVADELYQFEYSLKASANNALGNPYLADKCKGGDAKACNVACYQYNTTVVDKVSVKQSNVNGVAYSSASVSAPRDISNNASSTGMGDTQNAFSCWTFPPIEDGQRWEVTSLEIDTAGTAPAAFHTINVSVATVDYDLNADDSSEIIGVEDEDFNSLGNGPLFLIDPIDLG